MLDLLEETYGQLILVGLLLFAVGAGLTFWSFVHRDPVTGEFLVWWKLMFVGTVITVSGLAWWKMS